jgi:ABC-type nitrate/sulfonate/bicarbonate transport system permease component
MSTQQKTGFNPRFLWKLLSLALVFGAWELAGRKPISIAFPTFSATAVAFFRMIADGTLPTAFGVPFNPLGWGYSLSGPPGSCSGSSWACTEHSSGSLCRFS